MPEPVETAVAKLKLGDQRRHVFLCVGGKCATRPRSQASWEHLKRRLGVGFNETTADGCVTLKEGECMGACGDAPVLLVDNKRMCSFMSGEKLDALVEELKK